jgi:polyisoprenoid-binding protein YceI
MTNETHLESNERPAVGLHINGSGLLVSGSFSGWQSRLVLGPDLDDVSVNLFIDATSVGFGRDEDVGEKLFSFRSSKVTPSGKGTYKVVGDFTGAEETREMELELQTPLGHTPMFAISFNAGRKDFGDGFTHLVENTTLFGVPSATGEPIREANAWLTAPYVAAA